MPVSYELLQRNPAWRPGVIPRFDDGPHAGEHKIRCPLCAWQPQRSDLWTCGPCPWPEGLDAGCFTNWHTFDTGGLCPGCDHQWTWTSCLACEGWSLHADWYTGDQ